MGGSGSGDGLVVRFADGDGRTIAPKPVKVVSSHGAGDCFLGALAAKIASGAPLLQAAEFANATAAAHVSGQGVMGSEISKMAANRYASGQATPPSEING